MTAGGKRPNAGRPPGAKNLLSREAVMRAKQEGILPLDYFLQIMRNPLEPEERRFTAAEAAAPYLHPKLSATHTNVTGLVSQIDVSAPGALASKFAALNDRIFNRVTAIANAVAAVPVSKEELDNDCD